MIFGVIEKVEEKENGFRIKIRTGGGREFFATNFGLRSIQTKPGKKPVFAKSRRKKVPKIGEKVKFIPGQEPGRARRWVYS